MCLECAGDRRRAADRARARRRSPEEKNAHNRAWRAKEKLRNERRIPIKLDHVLLHLVQHHEVQDAYAVSEYTHHEAVWVGKAHVSRYFEIGRTKPFIVLGKKHRKYTGKWGGARSTR